MTTPKKIDLGKIAEAFRVGRETVPTRCVGRVIDILDGKVIEADHQGAVAIGLGMVQAKTFPFASTTWWWDKKLVRPLLASPCMVQKCYLMLYPQYIDVILAHLSDVHDGKTGGHKHIRDEQVYEWLKAVNP